MEGLPDTLVQLVVGYRAPEGRLRVGHRLQVCSTGATASFMPTTVQLLPMSNVNPISKMAKGIAIQDIIEWVEILKSKLSGIVINVLTKIGSKKTHNLLFA